MKALTTLAGITLVVSSCGTVHSGATNSSQPDASRLERSERAQPNPEDPRQPSKRLWMKSAPWKPKATAVAAAQPALRRLPNAGKAAVPPQSAVWRCEIDYRCYDTDDVTGERQSLLRSGTAWYEEPSEYPQGSPGDMNARGTACSETSRQFAGGAVCETGYPDFYELELEPEIGCRCERR